MTSGIVPTTSSSAPAGSASWVSDSARSIVPSDCRSTMLACTIGSPTAVSISVSSSVSYWNVVAANATSTGSGSAHDWYRCAANCSHPAGPGTHASARPDPAVSS